MANSFGHLFRITTRGESHGGGVGVGVDGCPPRLELTEADIQPDLGWGGSVFDRLASDLGMACSVCQLPEDWMSCKRIENVACLTMLMC